MKEDILHNLEIKLKEIMIKIIYIFSIAITIISCSKKYTGKVNFKDCTINYPLHNEEKERKLYHDHNVPNEWEYESAIRKLALCLCEKYIQKPDIETKEKIIQICKYKFEFYNRDDSFKKVNFDSILANRKVVFDPEIMID